MSMQIDDKSAMAVNKMTKVEQDITDISRFHSNSLILVRI